jgi:hypothetical protein
LTDNPAIIAALIPTMFAATIAVSSRDIDLASFVEPALHAHAAVARELRCKCSEYVTWPFVEASVMRLRLSSFLFLLSAGLLIPVPFLAYQGEITAELSFLLYFVVFSAFNFYYVFARKYVPYWWTSVLNRCLLVMVIGTITTMAEIRPESVDMIAFLLGGSVGPAGPAFWAVVILIPVYLILRAWTFRVRPSLRRIILAQLDRHPSGYTIDGWVELLNPEGKPSLSRKQIEAVLHQLTYEGTTRLRLASRTGDPVYGK